MIKDLQTQVEDEGTQEATTYDKFACFCQSKTDEKSTSIGEGETAVETITAAIGTLSATRAQLEIDSNDLNAEIAGYQEQLKDAKSMRGEEKHTFEQAFEDMTAAVSALERAIDQLKASKTASLASVKALVRKSLVMADALDVQRIEGMNQKVVTMLLSDEQAPEIPTEDYTFQSGSIIETLEGLLGTFRAKKTELEGADAQAGSDYDLAEQAKKDQESAAQTTLAAKQAELAKTTEDLSLNNADLTEKNAVLNDDRLYLKDLSSKCETKAKQWDQRSAMRAEELAALTQALGVLEGTVATKAGATGGGGRGEAPAATELSQSEDVSFVQVKDVRRVEAPEDLKARKMIIELLKRAGKRLNSKVLSTLAVKVSEDPFKKIKALIQDLIERLLQEEADEASHKGWCDTEMSKTTKQRDQHLRTVEELHNSIEQGEARNGTLAEDKHELEKGIAELQADLATATTSREDEKAENAQTVADAKEGVDAITQAIDILSHFYGKAAKGTVELAQGVDDESPDAGFDGAYTGSQGASGGILGMMDVIKSDFERSVSETEAAEAQAKRDFVEFERDTQMSLTTKETALTHTSSSLGEVQEQLGGEMDDIRTQQGLFDTAVSSLELLSKECVNGGADAGMSNEERVARREAEVAALKDAYCILNNEDAGCSGVFLQKRTRLS